MTDAERLDLIKRIEEFDLAAPITDADFEAALVDMGMYILFGTPWEKSLEADRKQLLRVPLLRDLPMICKGNDCPVAKRCPVIRGMSETDKAKLEGTECRAERAFAMEMLATHIKSLHIQMGDSDFTVVADLVRNFVLRRRIEWQISIDGETILTPNLMHQSTGKVYDKVESHPLKKEVGLIDKQINVLSRSLLISRKDKATVAANFGRTQQDLIKSLFNPHNPLPQPTETTETLPEPEEVIEAVFEE